MAEAMLAAKLKALTNVRLSSAGVAAPLGVAPDHQAVRSATALGYQLSPDKRSRQVQQSDLTSANLILVMEIGHKQYIRRRSPMDANKTFLFGEWTSGQIADPIGKSEEFFDEVTRIMEVAAESWVARVQGIATSTSI